MREWIQITYDAIMARTQKAILLRFEGDKDIWLPISQIDELDEPEGTVWVARWLVEEHNLGPYMVDD